MTRRHMLKGGLLSALTLPWLTSCRRRDSGELINALGWVPDVEYADLWVALERGYFAQQGIHLKVWPGGPNAPQPVVELSARQADVGEAEWLPFLDAVLLGNDFVIIASIYPIYPGGLISLPRRPVRTPADMVGARFLVQGPSERTTIEATFKLNHLPLNYQLIPVGFSPEPLLNGIGDAYYCFIDNQPFTLEAMGMQAGRDFFVTRFDQLGYKVPSTLVFARRHTVQTQRRELVSYLKGRLRGMTENIPNPAYAASLAVDKYGADLGLNLQQQTRTNEMQILLYRTPGSPGPFWITEDLTRHMFAAAQASGRKNLPPSAQILDSTLLAEAYRDLGMEGGKT
jgi:ABC-type nitrate/sulfonate/bicarbonate transport system substrate-binding protein